MEYKIERNSRKLTPEILHNLRIAVGWPSNVNNCENELTHTYSNFSASFLSLGLKGSTRKSDLNCYLPV